MGRARGTQNPQLTDAFAAVVGARRGSELAQARRDELEHEVAERERDGRRLERMMRGVISRGAATVAQLKTMRSIGLTPDHELYSELIRALRTGMSTGHLGAVSVIGTLARADVNFLNGAARPLLDAMTEHIDTDSIFTPDLTLCVSKLFAHDDPNRWQALEGLSDSLCANVVYYPPGECEHGEEMLHRLQAASADMLEGPLETWVAALADRFTHGTASVREAKLARKVLAEADSDRAAALAPLARAFN